MSSLWLSILVCFIVLHGLVPDGSGRFIWVGTSVSTLKDPIYWVEMDYHSRLFVASEHQVAVHAETGEQIALLPWKPREEGDTIVDLTIDPLSRNLLVATSLGYLSLWDWSNNGSAVDFREWHVALFRTGGLDRRVLFDEECSCFVVIDRHADRVECGYTSSLHYISWEGYPIASEWFPFPIGQHLIMLHPRTRDLIFHSQVCHPDRNLTLGIKSSLAAGHFRQIDTGVLFPPDGLVVNPQGDEVSLIIGYDIYVFSFASGELLRTWRPVHSPDLLLAWSSREHRPYLMGFLSANSSSIFFDVVEPLKGQLVDSLPLPNFSIKSNVRLMPDLFFDQYLMIRNETSVTLWKWVE